MADGSNGAASPTGLGRAVKKPDIKGKGRAIDQDETSDDGQASLHELEESEGFLPRGSTSSQGTSDGFPVRPGHRTRSSSIASLGFAFSGLHIPLTSESIDPAEATTEVKHLNLMGGISLIVGLMVGSGIFSSPASIHLAVALPDGSCCSILLQGILTADCGSVGAALCVWLAAGLLAWTGASSYAELGAAIPKNGGAQAYLRYAYGPTISYLYSWTAIIVLKPASCRGTFQLCLAIY